MVGVKPLGRTAFYEKMGDAGFRRAKLRFGAQNPKHYMLGLKLIPTAFT